MRLVGLVWSLSKDWYLSVSKNQTDDETDFAALFAGVKRLHNDRVNTYSHRPEKAVPGGQKTESENLDYAELSYGQQSEIAESYYNSGIQHKLRRKIRQGDIPVDDILDLHGCTQKVALIELRQFFRRASCAGFKSLIVVHGKGNRPNQSAVLKPLVHHWLSQQPSVLAWCPTQPKDGGSGASYVYLR